MYRQAATEASSAAKAAASEAEARFPAWARSRSLSTSRWWFQISALVILRDMFRQMVSFFLFSPLFGEDEPILTRIFSMGLVQPPASYRWIEMKPLEMAEK